MNTLTDPLKRIARDLVDRRLWPIAVLLLAAIVAVPVVIGGSSAEQAAAPAALAADAPAAPGSQSLVTVVDPAVTGEDVRPGQLEDPFYDPPQPPAQDTSPRAGGTPAGSEATKGGGTPAAGEQPAQSPTAPQPPAQPAEPAAARVYYRTAVRWYEHKAGKPRPLARLTPLGGLVETAAMYLGVTKSSGTYAVFLLGPNAISEGEAKCEDTACRVIGLKSGQTQVVTVQPPDGSEARQYHLDVVSVKAVATDAATARKMRLRVHADGRDVMREIWQDVPTAEALRPIQFDRDRGVLVKSARAAAAAKAASAAVPAEQPAE